MSKQGENKSVTRYWNNNDDVDVEENLLTLMTQNKPTQFLDKEASSPDEVVEYENEYKNEVIIRSKTKKKIIRKNDMYRAQLSKSNIMVMLKYYFDPISEIARKSIKYIQMKKQKNKRLYYKKLIILKLKEKETEEGIKKHPHFIIKKTTLANLKSRTSLTHSSQGSITKEEANSPSSHETNDRPLTTKFAPHKIILKKPKEHRNLVLITQGGIVKSPFSRNSAPASDLNRIKFFSERSNSSMSEKDDNSPSNRKKVPILNLTPLQTQDGKKSVSHEPTPESKKYTDGHSPGQYSRRTHSISIKHPYSHFKFPMPEKGQEDIN